MAKNSKRQSTSTTLARRGLFGPPPIVEGENAKDYYDLFERVFSAVRPTDSIEEIWVNDIANVAWDLLRLRRNHAEFLTAQVSADADNNASSLALTKLIEGMEGMDEGEKREMKSILNARYDLSFNNSKPTWRELVARNPRINKIFQDHYASAKATLDMTQIQAQVMIRNLDTIERMVHLITIAERRFDAVIHEIDRRRLTQKQLNSVQGVLDAEFEIVTPKINGRKTQLKKPHDQYTKDKD